MGGQGGGNWSVLSGEADGCDRGTHTQLHGGLGSGRASLEEPAFDTAGRWRRGRWRRGIDLGVLVLVMFLLVLLRIDACRSVCGPGSTTFYLGIRVAPCV